MSRPEFERIVIFISQTEFLLLFTISQQHTFNNYIMYPYWISYHTNKRKIQLSHNNEAIYIHI